MIVTEHLTKDYGDREVIRDLSLHIAEGECVGLLGENGAGKSTTLRMLACLSLPSAGRILVGGVDAEEHPERVRALLGYLPDTPPLYDEMAVAEYVRFAGRLRGLTRERVAQRLPRVLEQTGLAGVAEQRVGTLSHGYRQRVGIAQAIVHEPPLLILDEPINGLDPVQIVEMRELIQRLRGAHTILLSTHILSEIEQTCDRILMLHDGAIAAHGTEEELASRLGSGGFLRLGVVGGDEAAKRALEIAEGLGFRRREGASCDGLLALDGDSADHPGLARALVTAGLDLRHFEPVEEELEQLFLRVSRGASSTDGAGGPGADSTGAAARADASASPVAEPEEEAP